MRLTTTHTKQAKNPDEFTNLLQVADYFRDNDTCIMYLQGQLWKDGISCPHKHGNMKKPCGGEDIHVYPNHIDKFRCNKCKRVFNVKIGTIFENTKIPLKAWFMAIYLDTTHKKGISSYYLAKEIGVTQKTAWFMLHRIRMAYNQQNFKHKLGRKNVVEADHKYVGGKERNKHKEKKIPGSQGGANKMVIFGMVEREGGKATAYVVKDTHKTTTEKYAKQDIVKNASVCTDEGKAFKGFGKLFFAHRATNHAEGEYVKIGEYIPLSNSTKKDKIHSQLIEGGVWTKVQDTFIVTHKHTSWALAQRYLDGIVFRFNNREAAVYEIMNTVFENTNHRLTYNQLTAINRNN